MRASQGFLRRNDLLPSELIWQWPFVFFEA